MTTCSFVPSSITIPPHPPNPIFSGPPLHPSQLALLMVEVKDSVVENSGTEGWLERPWSLSLASDLISSKCQAILK